MSLTSNLADFSSGMKFDDIPDPIVDITKLVIFDSLICGLAAQKFERTKMMHSVIKQLGGPEESTVFGLRQRVAAPNAAMANAEIMNFLDADDTFFSSSHFAVFNVAAALAMGERERCSGKDLILATLVGFDVNARIDLSGKRMAVIDGEFKWSKILGMGFATIGAAVSAGIILGLTQEQMRNVFGIAGWFAPGPTSGRVPQTTEWSTMKYSPNSVIALAGALAAMYAKAGYSGDTNMLDGQDGFWKIQGSVSFDPGFLSEDLGRKWWIDETAIKFCPSCRYTSAPIDMLKKIMSENKLNSADIEHIEVRLNPMAYAIPIFNNPKLKIDGNSHCAPFNGEFNIPYLMALTALGKRPGPGWYKPELFEDEKVLNLMKKVTTAVDPAAAEEAQRALREERIGRFRKSGGSIKVRAKGQEYVSQTEYCSGDPWNPETRATWEAMDEKLHNFCDDLLTADGIRHITQNIRHLEEKEDISDILTSISMK